MEEKATYTAPSICTIKMERSQSLATYSNVKVDTVSGDDLIYNGDGDASTGL